MIYKTLHRKQEEAHYKPEVNRCAPEGCSKFWSICGIRRVTLATDPM